MIDLCCHKYTDRRTYRKPFDALKTVCKLKWLILFTSYSKLRSSRQCRLLLIGFPLIYSMYYCEKVSLVTLMGLLCLLVRCRRALYILPLSLSNACITFRKIPELYDSVILYSFFLLVYLQDKLSKPHKHTYVLGNNTENKKKEASQRRCDKKCDCSLVGKNNTVLSWFIPWNLKIQNIHVRRMIMPANAVCTFNWSGWLTISCICVRQDKFKPNL